MKQDQLADWLHCLEGGMYDWVVDEIKKELAKPEQEGALPPTTNAVYWMDMVVANLVRNGVNKHRARELAHHFYTYTTPIGEQA
tara:strand:+ start:1773 stop:2024 length:252 start_codon:yes stop_codon:yes gene_type:complete